MITQKYYIVLDKHIQWIYYKPMDRHELKTWRKQQGLTQGQLATMLGVKWLAVSRWERGERSIPALLPLALEGLERRFEREGK